MLFASAQNRKFRLASAVCGALTLIAFSTPLATQPAHAQTETVLYTFTDNKNGLPLSGLTADGAGNFYGTIPEGPGVGWGTVYELSPNGSGGWNETVLHSFCSQGGCADGAFPVPWGGVVFDTAGNLYGTTYGGGANGGGVVWELSPSLGGWTETVLYNFPLSAQGPSSCWGEPASGELASLGPCTGVIFDTAGNLYGQTGNNVFELSPSAGGWTKQVIAPYGSDLEVVGLTIDASGNIYGYTSNVDKDHIKSAVFKLSPNGTGGWNSSTIYTFPPTKIDEIYPIGTPVLDSAGNIYGVTQYGGKDGYGTVFKLTPVTSGKEAGTYKRHLLRSFAGGTQDGSSPFAGIVFDKTGNIYGTTFDGGLYGYGTVFELVAPAYSTEKLLFSFNGSDGGYPDSSLILDKSGNLYGTGYAVLEGNGVGVAYEITP